MGTTAFVVLSLLSCFSGFGVWRLGKRVAWPEYLAKLWMGFWTLVIVGLLGIGLTVAGGCLAILCGLFPLPYQLLFQEVDLWLYGAGCLMLQYIQRFSRTSFWVVGTFVIILIGYKVGGRLYRLGSRIRRGCLTTSPSADISIEFVDSPNNSKCLSLSSWPVSLGT
jgi:hypothetical protein